MDNALAVSDSGHDTGSMPCGGAIRFLMVVAKKTGALPSAVASSLSVSKVAGAEFATLIVAAEKLARAGHSDKSMEKALVELRDDGEEAVIFRGSLSVDSVLVRYLLPESILMYTSSMSAYLPVESVLV